MRNNGARVYTSFEGLMNPSVRFDLSQGQFLCKKPSPFRKQKDSCDVNITFRRRNKGEKQDAAFFSFKKEAAEILAEHCGGFLTIGIVRSDRLERLYIVGDDDGFSMFDGGKSTTRKVCIFPIKEQEEYRRYTGRHSLFYDKENDEYYITVNR